MIKKYKNFVAVIMAMIMIITSTSIYLPVTAEEGVITTENAVTEFLDLIPTEAIPAADLQKNNFIGRDIPAENDLHSVNLINSDGTNSLYIFDTPVKYIDAFTGEVKDKSNKLYKAPLEGYAYVNLYNDINTYFPVDIIDNPILLKAAGKTVETSLVSVASSSVAILLDEYSVFYKNAFGAHTGIIYKTDFSGYKEVVVLMNSKAPIQYSFNISCSGMYIRNDFGMLSYIDIETDEVIFTSEPYYIYDSATTVNSYTDTDYTVTKISEGEYQITVTLDEDFLAKETLTYPIYIDPVILYNEDNLILDAAIYSSDPNTNFGSQTFNYIADNSSRYKQGKILIQMPYLMSNLLKMDISNYDVFEMDLYLYAYPCNSPNDSVVTTNLYFGASWQENTVTWNNAGEHIPSTTNSIYNNTSGYTLIPINSTSVESTKNGFVKFNIGDKTNNYIDYFLDEDVLYAYGQPSIILSSGSSLDDYVCFRSSESGTAYQPYVIIKYTAPLSDGIYYLRNVATEKYMDLEGPYLYDGANIQQWGWHGNDQQKWIITRRDDGYYNIQSVYSGKYVGVEDNSSDTGITIKQFSTSVNSGAGWIFKITDNANFKISAACVAYDDTVLAVPSTSSTDGVDLIQTTYTDDSSYNDEWRLIALNVHELELLYDNAYLSKYSTATTRINNAINVLKQKYYNEFGLTVTSTSPVKFTSYADQCTNLVDGHCSCSGLDNESHHTNYNNIIDNIEKPTAIHQSVMAFVGHNTCLTTTNNHRYFPYSGLTLTYQKVMMITEFEGNLQETLTVIHEFGHIFGAPDHYGAGATDAMNTLYNTNNFDDHCIYGADIYSQNTETYNDILENLPICMGCRKIIQKNVFRYLEQE